MKNDLISNINKLIYKAHQVLKDNVSNKERKELSEIYLSLAIFNDNFNIDPISETSIKFLMNKIIECIYYEGYFNFYMQFYYLPVDVFNKDSTKLSTDIYLSNINISCFRALIHASDLFNFSLDSSANNNFFKHGSRIVTAINNYMSYPFEFDISSMVYLALNYYQALCEYEICSDVTYKNYIVKLKKECENLFILIYSNNEFSEIIKSNSQLLGFWCSIVAKDLKFDFSVDNVPKIINLKYLWTLCSYFEYNSPDARKIIDDFFNNIISIQGNIETALVTRLLCFSLMYDCDTDLTGFEISSIPFENSNRCKYPLSYFFKNYDEINQEICTNQDLNKLLSLNDTELRLKVSKCMQNIDINELERQISKPHGALEISDLDVKFTENNELKYLCMPFKTGREIKSATLSETYMYQLIKPFSHFGNNCLVVLITAKKCSQGLETYIERMSVREPSWRIEVIQYEQLCKLLKINNQLY